MGGNSSNGAAGGDGHDESHDESHDERSGAHTAPEAAEGVFHTLEEELTTSVVRVAVNNAVEAVAAGQRNRVATSVGPARQRFRSIAGQTIATTAALVTVIVAVFLAITWQELSELGEEQAEARGATMDKASRAMAMSLARNTAVASSAALVESEYLYLHTLVETTARSDSQVTFVLVADESGRIVADSRVPLSRTPQAPLADAIWKRIRTAPRSLVTEQRDPQKQDHWVFAAPIVIEEENEDGLPTGKDSVIGHVRVGMTMVAQQREVAAARAAAHSRVRRAVRLAALAALVLLISGIGIAVIQGLRISRPIMRLSEQAERIALGELDRRVDPQGATEIQHLSENFNYMADRISDLLKETARKAAVEKELEIAHLVQTSLVPRSELIHARGIDLAGYFQPASKCGGDWWLFKHLDRDRIIVLIADVTGHGLPAALITAAAIGCTEALPPDTTATSALVTLNRTVCSAGRGKFLMTCFSAVFDPNELTCEFANAGHPMPYLGRKDGDRWVIDSLVARGPLLGEHETPSYTVQHADLGPDDLIIWYTDGISECFGPSGHPWGEGALRRALQEAFGRQGATGCATADPIALRDDVISAVRTHAGSVTQRDDITLVVGTGLGRELPEAKAAGDSLEPQAPHPARAASES